MGTKIDSRFMYLRFEYGLTETQINDLVNEVIASNELLLANSSNRDSLLYDLVVNRLTGTVKEAEVTKDQDTNSNEGWCDIVTDSRIMKNKKFKYGSYVIGVATGNYNQETQDFRSYSYKNTLKERIANFLEEAKADFPNGKIPAVKTVEKHLTEMVKCDMPLEIIKIENTPNGVVYKLRNRVDNRYYVQLPYRQIRELVTSTNSNMIKLFAVLKYELNDDCKTFRTIDRKYLARQIGLSDNSANNVRSVGTMLVSLAKLGYIEIRQDVRTDYDAEAGREIGKKVNSYRLRTLEEYDNINLIARGKVPKK